MPPASAAKAALSYVVPVATYGAEVWYPGALVPNMKRGKDVPDVVTPLGLLGLVARVNKVFTQAARAVLPVPGTTPNNAVLHAIGLPPAEV